MKIANFIAFDLEGPLSPRDNAYDLMRLFPGGDRVFEVISRYDDLLTLEGRADYEPGDTLALIVPFILLHGLCELDIRSLAERAELTAGAAQLISRIGSLGWKVFCITTTYEQYASRLAGKLGINTGNLACTGFPLSALQSVTRGELELVRRAEEDILSLRPVHDDESIKRRLDALFRESLPPTSLGGMIREVKPCGGRRKVEALLRFAEAHSQPPSAWVVVGDSITDSRMLETIDRAGGLAVAFNANEYAIPCATMSLASPSLYDLAPVLDSWAKDGRGGVERLVKNLENQGKDGAARFFWVSGRRDLGEVIRVSKAMRRLVREEAGKLG